MTTNGGTPPIDAWHVESTRVTAFASDVVAVENLSWWDEIVGVPPETVVSHPKTGQYQTHGDFEGRRIGLQIQPGRIEWNANPILKGEDEPSSLQTLGPFRDAIAFFSKVVAAWLPLAPPLNRLAFGAVLLQPVESAPAGYALIQKYLEATTRIDLKEASDFFFQINRPRRSRTEVTGLRVNRLTRWAVQVAQRMTLTLGAGGPETRTLGQETACRLELDINTAPDFGVLPANQLGAILQELMNFGSEIAQRGDIA
jgi:hypothetical protein